jgi:hypothetical protein
MLGSDFFRSYTDTLSRVLFIEMIDEHSQAQNKRRLSIVGPCYTHEQWLAVQAERRAAARRAEALAQIQTQTQTLPLACAPAHVAVPQLAVPQSTAA